MTRRAAAAGDAGLYAASALVAVVVPLTTDVPLDNEWARIAAPVYTTGALAAMVQAARGATTRSRAMLAAAVFAAVVVVPLIAHAEARAEGGSAEHVKSDVLVIEEASASLLAGRNPYAVVFDEELSSWPGSTRSHFPYLPAMLLLGMPRALAGPGLWTDPRILSLVLTLAIALPSLAMAAVPAKGRLRALQLLLVLVTGAPLAFTSAKELPVLALLLLSLVALDQGRLVLSGVAVGVAAATHQLAWVVLPFLALVPRESDGSRRGGLSAVVATAASIAVVAPFLVWEGSSFLEDVVRFPLGFGQPRSDASLAPGSLIASVFPGARWALVVALVIAVAVGVIALGRIRTSCPGSDVARGAGTLLLLLLLVAPRVRMAYFVFPLNLLLWSRLALRPPPAAGDAGRYATVSRVRKRSRGDRMLVEAGTAILCASPPHQLEGRGNGKRDQREEAAAHDGTPERLGLARDPNVEDQHDDQEGGVTAQSCPNDVTRPHPPGPSDDARRATGPDGRPTHGDHDHRDEQEERRCERGDDDLEHRSAPEEERPAPDEHVPPKPQPEAEE